MTRSHELIDAMAVAESAAPDLFCTDPRLRIVGVEGLADGGYGLVATYCDDVIAPLRRHAQLPPRLQGLALRTCHISAAPQVLARAQVHMGTRRATSALPEQALTRPLLCGLEVQNHDADARDGAIAQGRCEVGTLGCFVVLPDGAVGLLSNNHVLAAENHGRRQLDRIFQCASLVDGNAHAIATLEDFVQIQTMQCGSTQAPVWPDNHMDAAVARLLPDTAWMTAYHASRAASAPHHVDMALPGQRVHKVGRSSGLTFGTVTQVGVQLSSVDYRDGPARFKRVLLIEGDDGQPFACQGDSGAAIVRTDGALVGLLFAGSDAQAYACDAELTLAALHCRLA